MSIDVLILVTGAAGRLGGVGGTIVEMLRQLAFPSARWSVAKMSVPKRCAPSAPRSWSATSPGPGMWRGPWRVADACISA